MPSINDRSIAYHLNMSTNGVVKTDMKKKKKEDAETDKKKNIGLFPTKVGMLYKAGLKTLPKGQRLRGDYQGWGVMWMLQREMITQGQVRGGINADDMGLGKTMLAIVVIKANKNGPTLIVVEVSCLDQWKDALMKFGGIRPVVFHSGSETEIDDNTEVVLTTYSVFQQGGRTAKHKHKNKKAKRDASDSDDDDEGSNGNGVPGPLKRRWWRIILDEAHKIRNPKTKLFRAINSVSADIKWGLTATPIQNTAADLETLASWIGIKGTIKNIRETYVLRRTIEQEQKGCKALQLVPLDTEIVYLAFKYPKEEKVYDALLDEGRREVDGGVGSGMLAILNKVTNEYFLLFSLIFSYFLAYNRRSDKRASRPPSWICTRPTGRRAASDSTTRMKTAISRPRRGPCPPTRT